MAMGGRTKFMFHHKVLAALLILCWVLVGAFLVFQYHREKNFRLELLDMELQMHNERILDDMQRGESIEAVVARIGSPFQDLRLTLIDKSGAVIYDNNDRTPFPTTNHNNRPEVIDARKKGTGYSLGRKSESDDTEYFYSATLTKAGDVIRSAAPYNHSLQDFLSADRKFIWIMVTVTFAVSLAGYFITRKISTSITRLNSFAEKAERGEKIYDQWGFPKDKLGNIAGHIVRLYVQREDIYKESLKQESEKNRLKKQLTDNINHELKTPVASIKLCAELLRDHPELSEGKRRDFIKRICDNTVRLTSLLDDVASITRMEDGVSVIEMENTDLSGLIKEIVESEKLRTDMKFTIDIPKLEVNGNRQLLESLFRNLIDNAIAYSGGSEIIIKSDEKCNFVFKDNGVGISPEHLPHIFERFYRIDKGRSRKKGDTGLGLAIVKNTVTLHGGDIKVSVDNGLRYDFNLA